MDDDVILQPEAIYRTYKLLTLLKQEYQDSYVGGAMLRTDKQWFQTEAGGRWNCGALISCKSGLDLRDLNACLCNEFEEKYEFNAWWYCVIPMEFIRKDNLPLPIFIRGDDVEYGLRNMKHLILMNGICVWHEPFEFKYSSIIYYYIFRNRLIGNAVRNIEYSQKQFIKEFRNWFKRELFMMRYQNADLLLDGVIAFLNGIDWFKKQDGEEIHRQVIARGYKLKYIDELDIPFDYGLYEKTLHFFEPKMQQIKRKILLNGIFLKPNRIAIVPVIEPHIAYVYRAGAVLHYDVASKKGFVTYKNIKEFRNLYFEYCKVICQVKKKYKMRKKEWFERKDEITNLDFWNKYLNL